MALNIPGFTPMEDQGDGHLHYRQDPDNDLIDSNNEIRDPPVDDLFETVQAQQLYVNPRRRIDTFQPLVPRQQIKMNSFSHRGLCANQQVQDLQLSLALNGINFPEPSDPNLAPFGETEMCLHCETIPQVKFLKFPFHKLQILFNKKGERPYH